MPGNTGKETTSSEGKKETQKSKLQKLFVHQGRSRRSFYHTTGTGAVALLYWYGTVSYQRAPETEAAAAVLVSLVELNVDAKRSTASPLVSVASLSNSGSARSASDANSSAHPP